ncbi:MAG: polyphosphate polymerase domain-containing protein [Paracoccaceae bacterium]
MYTNRFELKYLIQTKNVANLLDSFGSILIADKNNQNHFGYFNHSIYFDTHKLRFYRDKQEGLAQRLKPRIRVYRKAYDFSISSIFLELKQKNDRTVFKNRVEIDLEYAKRLLHGAEPTLNDKVHEVNETMALFYQLSKRYFLRPKVAVNYKRFAYFSDLYPNLRVTIDQSMEASLDVSLDVKKSSFVNIISPKYTLVELKYNNRLPQILSSIIRAHELKNITFSKYSSAMEVAYEKARPKQRYRNVLYASAIKG